ncbi:hypothetical protein BBF96_12950 [Anoxybacter fermentans]|uniref:histidine kinase n=1 Tax=Anoxybacter fermentans TaxID=1323375 RepID=A0A3Q9HRT8_9FIRM|nr:HAMP domain-containing sensor histidine kinase [Anoxybacter fermentans]AZR74225.1 hypothetical protein BBF96_12950 [Anoxybacter fermentans]
MIRSIFGKLMIRFTGLILLILFILSISLTYFFEDYYFQTKEKEFINVGQKIAAIAGQSVLRGSLYYTAVMTQLQRSAQLIDEHIWIADRQGMIQAATAGERWLGVKLDREAVTQVLNGKIIAIRGAFKYFEEPILMVAVPIEVNNQVLGAVFVYNTIAGISGTIQKLRQLLITIGLAVLVLAIFLSYQFSRSISDPLRKISSAAIEMADGNYDVQLEVDRQDEIGQLAANFNFLCQKLRDHLRLQREFVGNVSHELKTPLTSIRGYVKALRDGIFEDEDSPEEYCNIIMNEVDRMNRLVTELLDLSKIESGIIKFKKMAFELEEVIRKTVSNLVPIIEKGRYKIEVELASNLKKAWGDPDRIGQVLINLVRNAIKHSEPGSTIWIRANMEDEMIKVEVEDEGCGIPAEELDHIWNRFYKVDKARTRGEEEGTGLGLAIVKEIIERHGGKVDVKSEVGKGSVFSFTIKSV